MSDAKILSTTRPELPPVILEKVEPTSTVFGLDSAPRVEERSPVPPNGTHFEVWLSSNGDGRTNDVSPEDAVRMIEAGEAVLADPERARAAILWLADEARLPQEQRARYLAPIGAHWRRVRSERRDRLYSALGLDVDDENFDPASVPLYLSPRQLATIFGVDERTVRREAGRSLPAPLRIGRQLRFRVDALVGFMERAA